MKAQKINDNNKNMVINLLQNVNGLKIENYIINNCHLLLDDKDDIIGTISYEKFNNFALIRYFVFKKNISYNDLFIMYNHLVEELINKNINACIAIVNSEDVKVVFEYLGFNIVNNENIFLEEIPFNNTRYKNDKIYIKKII